MIAIYIYPDPDPDPDPSVGCLITTSGIQGNSTKYHTLDKDGTQ